jgi:hypothetical protein
MGKTQDSHAALENIELEEMERGNEEAFTEMRKK